MSRLNEPTNEASAMQKEISAIAEQGGGTTKVEQLIQQYCPDGVEYKKLRELANVAIGEFVRKDKQTPDAPYPVYNGGCSNTGFYEQFNMKAPKVIMSARGAGAGFVNYIDQDFWAGNSCYAISPQTNRITIKYLYYYLKHNETAFLSNQQKGGIPAVSKKQVEDFSIPVPPLPVQEEIVRILDTFAELQAELQAELRARQGQYLYYQDLLLNKSQYSKHITIGELCVVKKGNTPIQKAKEGKYPLVVTTMARKSCDTFQFDANAVCIPLVSSRGHGVASLNHIYYQEGKFALGNILCAVIPTDEQIVKAKYLYYYLEYAKDYTLVPLMKGGANVSLHCSDIEKVKIPLPSLSEQERIISILDCFDDLVNDLSQGLPAEIEARRKQYEYYRDQLLTFKQKA